MIKIKNVKTKVYEELTDFFAKEGFVLKKTKNIFEKQEPEFKNMVFFSFTAFPNSISIDLSIYARFFEVEDIFTKITGDSDYATIGNEVGHIYNSKNGKDHKPTAALDFNISTQEEVEAVIDEIKLYYENIIHPYFGKYQNLEDLDQIFNNPPYHYNPIDIGGSFGSRCSKGLIIARLIGKNIYDDLIPIYDAEMIEVSERAIKNYDNVKEYLKYNKV